MRIRLDKYIASMGYASRSEVKELARAGRIQVNGTVAKKSDIKLSTDTDEVLLDGAPIVYQEFQYFMLNKPAGVVSARSDAFDKTVVDLIEGFHRADLFPVGRLDKDTVGLLLITNDGQLAHRLLAPNKHVDKQYFVRLELPVDETDAQAFAQGIDIGDDTLTLPAVLRLVPEDEHCAYVTLHEGRFHQVKRMFEARGNSVVYLKRVSMDSLVLDETLQEGQSRPLTTEELALLMQRF